MICAETDFFHEKKISKRNESTDWCTLKNSTVEFNPFKAYKFRNKGNNRIRQ